MRLGAVLGVFVLLLSAAQVASAQGASPAPSGQASAREAFRRGEAAYSAGNYEVAVREWTNAYAIDPRPRIQFNLSQAYERMGQLENAIAALQRFVESGDPEDPTYADANARLVALRQRLASTGVVLRGGAEGGAILVDDRDWGRTPRPDKITVSPGNHVIVIRWPSGRELRNNVYVPAGQVVEIDLPADAGEGPVAQPPSSAPAPVPVTPAEPQRSKKRVVLYSLGSGVAAAGLGLIAYGAARFVRRAACDDEDIYCNPDSESAARTQGIAGVAVGSALLAGSAALFIVGAFGSHGQDRRAGTTCAVGLTGGTCSYRF